MNRIYRFLSLIVFLMAAMVTMFSALADEPDNAGCSAEGAMFDDGSDAPFSVSDASVRIHASP